MKTITVGREGNRYVLAVNRRVVLITTSRRAIRYYLRQFLHQDYKGDYTIVPSHKT